ncbi:MAG TPA: hypothetical protein PKK94_26525 [Leptospiraceae bacterium]|nr:hypothetical protein [Leptospiraceae bacterium]
MKETRRQRWKKTLNEIYRHEDCIVLWYEKQTVCIPMRLLDFDDSVFLMRILMEHNQYIKDLNAGDDWIENAHHIVLNRKAKQLNQTSLRDIWDKIRNFFR